MSSQLDITSPTVCFTIKIEYLYCEDTVLFLSEVIEVVTLIHWWQRQLVTAGQQYMEFPSTYQWITIQNIFLVLVVLSPTHMPSVIESNLIGSNTIHFNTCINEDLCLPFITEKRICGF